MLWLFLSCDASGIPPVGFALDPVDLGDARVSGEGMDLSDGAAAGLAFAAVMPGWEAGGLPPWDVPAAIWEIALHERVADEGVCPFVTLDGGDATYQSDCRSKHGYEWEGTAKVTRSDKDGIERERWDYDLSVVGDIDDARFERLSLRGAVARAVDGDLTHVDVNLQMELLGYFEARDVEDVRIASWSDWQASGGIESEGDDFSLSLGAAVGGNGGFTLAGEALSAAADCPVEPTGTAQMGNGAEAVFEGAEGCDACATITTDEATTPACAP